MNNIELIQFLSKEIINKSKQRDVFVVAISGPDASGKSQLAVNLQEELEKRKVNNLLIQGDWFHFPKEQRERATGNLDRQFLYQMINFDRLKEEVLKPVSKKEKNITFTHHDYDTDKSEVESIAISHPLVLLVEGIFILRPSLKDYFDLKIYIHVDPEVTLSRAIVRDEKRYGSKDRVKEVYTKKYLAGQELHRKLHDPMATADIVVNNNNWKEPIITK